MPVNKNIGNPAWAQRWNDERVREHLPQLVLYATASCRCCADLGARRIVPRFVVVTKVDLVPPDDLELAVDDIRGNLDTRIDKVRQGLCDAVVLAAAGLHRLGWQDRISGYSRDVWRGMKMDDCVACHRQQGLEHSCLDCHK